MTESEKTFKILPDTNGKMPETEHPKQFKILPDANGNMPDSGQAKPFEFMPKPKAELPSKVSSTQPADKLDSQSIENPRLHKALTEMVYNFLKKESPDKDPDSEERKQLIKAAVNVIKPVVLANSQDEPMALAKKITKELFIPERGKEDKSTDAGLVAWEIRNTNSKHNDETISNGSKFLFIDGLVDKLKTGIEEHLVIIRNAKINKNPEPERELTPFEKEFKQMLVNVIEKAANIKRGTEKSEIMSDNIVEVAARLIKTHSSKLNDPAEAAAFLSKNLLEPKDKDNLHTVAGQVSYDLYYQAKKNAFGGIAPDWAVQREVTSLIKAQIIDYERNNPGKLVAMINEENKQEKRDKAIAQIGGQLNESGVKDGDNGPSLLPKALPPTANGFVR